MLEMDTQSSTTKVLSMQDWCQDNILSVGVPCPICFMATTMFYDFTGMAIHTFCTNTVHRDVTTDDTGHCINASNCIVEEVEKLAVDTNVTLGAIWLAIVDKFYMQSGPSVCGVSKLAVENRHTIDNPLLSKVKGYMQGFFQFQCSWQDDIKSLKDTTGIDHVAGWAYPELRNLLLFEN
ncbi:Hypothetical protein PHPALM_8578 [Phytophthora palmivora]|uniref:Uncharacterized protein n=1 Tax=Phytophthora palmivora TaxID=4796 RepID=A0A2P4Y9H3_9STRA|nr:Hypothetical protein PHPALM_8578 [Phytophthora palmivora]